MRQINIVDLLKLLNKYFPNAYYSIMDIDAMMSRACLPNGGPAFEYIDRNIKNYSTGCTFDYDTMLNIAKKFDDVKDLIVVINKNKNEIYGYDENKIKKYMEDSYLEFIVDDLELIEIYCKDSHIEGAIKNIVGELPLWVICGE